MRKNLDLYIAGVLVDTTDDIAILFNYEGEDVESPLAVRNSWSQAVTLPRTPVNEGVFSHISRLDHNVTASSFNPLERAPFVLYNELGEIMQRGYVKLESVSRDGYSVTLYGELGTIFAELSYNPDGSTKSLADLVFIDSQASDDELDFTINRSNVAQAWGVLSSGTGYNVWKVVNFVTAYNGIPENFDAKACIFSRDGAVLRATLNRDFTDIEAAEYRSYLLRPAVSVKAVIDAICDPQNNGGYTITIPSSWAEGNPYYENTWMTLPMLNKRDARGFGTGQSYKKADILGGTMSPADFLLSWMKMLRLRLVVDVASKTAEILPASLYYLDSVDIEDRIDRAAGIVQTPVLAASKWYDMQGESESAFTEYYQKKYGKPYGGMHIDTNTNFNLNPVDITESVKFKVAPSSLEYSVAFRRAWETRGDTDVQIPAMFLEGGTYTTTNGGETTTHDILNGKFLWQWWRSDREGADFENRIQLHSEDNKAIAGDGVLLFFSGMDTRDAGYFRITDDDSAMGDKPCWNYSGNPSAAGACLEFPLFSRFTFDSVWRIANSWEFGEPKELNTPTAGFAPGGASIYHLFWKRVLQDRYNVNTSRVTVKVDFTGIQVGEDTLRHFYYFDGCYWVLNKIKNYSADIKGATECEFIKVQNTENYQ